MGVKKHIPRPIPCRALVDPEAVPATRRLHCRYYDDCLDVAATAGWAGFACGGCGAFRPLSPMAEKRDLRGALELLVELRLTDLTCAEDEE